MAQIIYCICRGLSPTESPRNVSELRVSWAPRKITEMIFCVPQAALRSHAYSTCFIFNFLTITLTLALDYVLQNHLPRCDDVGGNCAYNLAIALTLSNCFGMSFLIIALSLRFIVFELQT